MVILYTHVQVLSSYVNQDTSSPGRFLHSFVLSLQVNAENFNWAMTASFQLFSNNLILNRLRYWQQVKPKEKESVPCISRKSTKHSSTSKTWTFFRQEFFRFCTYISFFSILKAISLHVSVNNCHARFQDMKGIHAYKMARRYTEGKSLNLWQRYLIYKNLQSLFKLNLILLWFNKFTISIKYFYSEKKYRPCYSYSDLMKI